MSQEKDDHGKKEQIEKAQNEASGGESETQFGKAHGQEEREKDTAGEDQEEG